jgi:cation:H+ antiporter
MLFSFLLIALGVAGVSFGANDLVSGGSSIAKRFNISDLIIGLTIVALGTSAPELIVGLTAAWNGKAEVALGNVVGSNIANICLILGICAIITPMYLRRNTVRSEIPLVLLASFVCLFLSQDQLIDGAATSAVTRIDGLVLLSFFLVYMAYMFSMATTASETQAPPTEAPAKQIPVWLAGLMVLGGIVGLALGGDWIVKGASEVARQFGMSEALIGLTLVSVGTSIPELATSLLAATQRKSDIVLGNVVGSNLFNAFLILGASSTLSPLPLGSITLTDFLVNIAASIFVVAAAFFYSPSKITRVEGICLLLLYAGYMYYLFTKI